MNEHTYLKYMEHGYLLTDTATIIDTTTLETEKKSLILDQTIFYPQGGGQPYDQGVIKKSDNSASFSVEEVRFKDGIVYHIGTIQKGDFNKSDNVILSVDEERRTFNSRNHSAGHIIDIAMRNIGMQLTPGSGYHYPQGAYVEYEGTLEEDVRAKLKTDLEHQANILIEKAVPVSIKMVSLDELKKLAHFVPDYIPKDKPCRAMIVKGYTAIPCGGTHVQNTNEIRHITIDKISNKKGNVRVSYSIPT